MSECGCGSMRIIDLFRSSIHDIFLNLAVSSEYNPFTEALGVLQYQVMEVAA